MVEMTGVYQGQKHCEVTHGPSKAKIQTDAPKDNQGLGEAFSPTDLVGVALGTCVLTTMAIACDREGLKMEGATFTVKKEMISTPHRQIAKLHLLIEMPLGIPKDKRAWLQRVGEHCPVRKSLSPEVTVIEEYLWAEQILNRD